MELIIKEQIEREKPIISKFKLSIYFMHGDADADTDDWIYFGTTEEEKALLYSYIEVIQELHDCNNGYEDEEYPEVLKKYDKNIANAIQDLIPNDITCEDRSARLNDFDVTYFDKNGIEYKVEIKK